MAGYAKGGIQIHLNGEFIGTTHRLDTQHEVSVQSDVLGEPVRIGDEIRPFIRQRPDYEGDAAELAAEIGRSGK